MEEERAPYVSWTNFVKLYQKKNPSLSYGQCMAGAKEPYASYKSKMVPFKKIDSPVEDSNTKEEGEIKEPPKKRARKRKNPDPVKREVQKEEEDPAYDYEEVTKTVRRRMPPSHPKNPPASSSSSSSVAGKGKGGAKRGAGKSEPISPELSEKMDTFFSQYSSTSEEKGKEKEEKE